jgi:hypothetical protein
MNTPKKQSEFKPEFWKWYTVTSAELKDLDFHIACAIRGNPVDGNNQFIFWVKESTLNPTPFKIKADDIRIVEIDKKKEKWIVTCRVIEMGEMPNGNQCQAILNLFRMADNKKKIHGSVKFIPHFVDFEYVPKLGSCFKMTHVDIVLSLLLYYCKDDSLQHNWTAKEVRLAILEFTGIDLKGAEKLILELLWIIGVLHKFDGQTPLYKVIMDQPKFEKIFPKKIRPLPPLVWSSLDNKAIRLKDASVGDTASFETIEYKTRVFHDWAKIHRMEMSGAKKILTEVNIDKRKLVPGMVLLTEVNRGVRRYDHYTILKGIYTMTDLERSGSSKRYVLVYCRIDLDDWDHLR